MKRTKPEQLFHKAYHHNWDRGVAPLRKLLDQPDCDLATALLIYWHASPAYYNRYASEADIPAAEQPVFALMRTIEDRVASGAFAEHIRYSPPADRIPAALGRIPSIMLRPSGGSREAEVVLHGDAIERDFFDACCSGDVARVRELAERYELDLSAKYRGYSPIEVSTRHPELFDYLVAAGVNWKKKFAGAPLFHRACRADTLTVAERMLSLGQPIEAIDRFGRTALHAVVFLPEADWSNMNGPAATAFLLRHGARRDATDREGLTPADLARRVGNQAALALLAS